MRRRWMVGLALLAVSISVGVSWVIDNQFSENFVSKESVVQEVKDHPGTMSPGSHFEAEEGTVEIVNRESRLIDVSKIKEGAFVIFDGKWVERNVNNLEFHEFLRDAVSKEIKLVAIGEHTSKFFEALHLAGVNELRRENGISRNPAYWDPPLVGYKLKSGEGYTYPSILVSNTRDISELIEALRSW